MNYQQMLVSQRFPSYWKCARVIRGTTLKMFPMSTFAKHRIEKAKERLRNKLTYEYITSIPKYRRFTREQYEQLISGIETLSLILIESFLNGNNMLNHE